MPKTLFGEKFVDLVPPEQLDGRSLKAGDTIANAVVPVEFEEFFNDIYPLLTAVPPEKVSTTLTALATTLDGRGESLGESLVLANEYLKKLAPETAQAVDDITTLGQLSDSYRPQMDETGELLENSARLSRNVVDLDEDLADFFEETTLLAGVLERLVDRTGKNLITTADQSTQPLAVLDEYSSMIPCLMRGGEAFTEQHLDEIMENGYLHIELEIVSPQPTAYSPDEHPVIATEADIESEAFFQPDNHSYIDGAPALGAVCDQLNAAAAGHPRHSHAAPTTNSPKTWKLFGVRNSHNGKLGTDTAYE